MDVYIARQPIFDRKLAVFGYELLYRRSMNNFYEGVDGNQATRDLIYNAFFVMQIDDLTEGKVGFINFTGMNFPKIIFRKIVKVIGDFEFFSRPKH